MIEAHLKEPDCPDPDPLAAPRTRSKNTNHVVPTLAESLQSGEQAKKDNEFKCASCPRKVLAAISTYRNPLCCSVPCLLEALNRLQILDRARLCANGCFDVLYRSYNTCQTAKEGKDCCSKTRDPSRSILSYPKLIDVLKLKLKLPANHRKHAVEGQEFKSKENCFLCWELLKPSSFGAALKKSRGASFATSLLFHTHPDNFTSATMR